MFNYLQQALLADLQGLGATADEVARRLADRGFEEAEAAANLEGFVAARGWRDVRVEPLGDTGWLCITARGRGCVKVGVDLPEPVQGYIDAAEGVPTGELVGCRATAS